MKKLGIFLGFNYNSKIRAEGIGRLLGFILKGQVNSEVVIAMPEWLKEEFLNLLEDQNISRNNIEIVTTNKVPYGIRIFEKYAELKNRKRIKRKSKLKEIVNKGMEYVKGLMTNLLASKNIIEFILIGTWLGAILLIGAPFAGAMILMNILFKWMKKIAKFIYKKFKGLGRRAILYLYDDKDIGEVKLSLYNKVHNIELKRLIQKVNKIEDISAWYIPALFWPEVKEIKAKKIIAAPDIVYYDFPTQFATESDNIIHQKLRDTVKCADHIICYSEYVKDNHICRKFGASEDAVTVVPHGYIDMRKFIEVKKSVKGSINEQKIAVEVVERWIESNNGNEILRNIRWEQMRFVIYSSQVRPHKNILSLIKAIKILNRERYQNIKLIVTGNIYENRVIRQFINENGMENEIIQLYNLPSRVLAALNKLAICSINPTMFEGGFPFTFTEAYSVGTPSIMSDIEVTREIIKDDKLGEKMLFNPYNIIEMANKIEWGINNHVKLYNMQKELHEQFYNRQWEDVTKEYIDVFNKISKL